MSLVVAVLFGGLAVGSWTIGQPVPLSIAYTVTAACYAGASWQAWRHANDPLPPSPGSTSRWGPGRPEERWQ